ncbi:MAG: hypothetical protein WC777_05110 [Candidatus Gracilibacteria bacterium]|jgi:hypothetical protein
MKTEATMLEIGNFEDLEHLVGLLNQAFEGTSYRLEKVQDQKQTYLFIEDPLAEDEYECGMIQKIGKKAYAYSEAVHQMIFGAYQRYLETTGR